MVYGVVMLCCIWYKRGGSFRDYGYESEMVEMSVMSTKDLQHDGVNIAEGDKFSAFAGKICRESFGNSPFVRVIDYSEGSYRGPRAYVYENLPDGCVMDGAPDGIGTKVVISDAAGMLKVSARDFVAMTASDLMRFGGLSLVLFNILDVSSLGEEGDQVNVACRELIAGLGVVATEQKFVIHRGETAELSACVSSDNPNGLVKYNWGAVMLGVYHPDRMILGDTLKSGQIVVALREYGFRSNGISNVRAAFKMHFGDDWFRNPEAQESICQAAEPSVLYNRFLQDMNGWVLPDFKRKIRMHLIAHLSGGGIRSKFAEDVLIPRGLSAELDDLWEPPEIMRKCAEWRGMSDADCYYKWNGGQGALVVLDERDVDEFCRQATHYAIEARPCGRITSKRKPEVAIESKFRGETIVYS